jgi:hypothetical protein
MPITDAWIGDSVQETLAAATEGTAAADGTQVATFTSDNTSDPASAYVATIDWGDGTTTTGTLTGSNGAFTVLGPVGGHIYADEGNETVSVTVTRPADGTVSTGAGTVAVAEGDVLTAQPSTFTATSNIAFNGAVATFTDTNLINLPGDFAATINWGDATTTVGTVTGSNGLFTVSGTHTYMAAGTDVVTVTLTDDAPAATATANSTANVGTVLTVQETLAAATAGTAAADGTPIVGLPADRLYDWNPGLDSVGGIPDRTTVFTTVNPGGDIQAAIDACPPGEVVQLAAGTFTVNNYLLIDKGITLRGAVDPVTNAPLTFLQKTNGATPGSYTAPDYQPIIIVGPGRYGLNSTGTSTNLTSDAVAGTYSITLASTAGLSPGQFVLLDENDYTSASFIPLPNRNGSPTSAEILASDRVVFQDHNPSDPGDDPFPDSLTWFSRMGRPLNEIKEIASISGNTVTFTSPITIDYTVSKTAQLTSLDPFVQDAGIENLSLKGGSDGNVRFQDTAYSWMKNVDDTGWLGEGVAIDSSFRDEVEGSYIHDGAWPAPGGGGYAISLAWGSAEALIENNIILRANKMMVGRSAGAGTVVAYNYADDGFINYDPSWQEVGINGSHMVGSHSWLFEGNESFNYDSDNTHGNAIYMTVFRNDLTGQRTDFPSPDSNARAVGLMFGSWWQTIIGNVLGTPGMTGWTYQSPGLGNQWSNDNIWEIGYDPQHWEQDADPKTVSTLIRGGNYDYVTNSVHWENIPSQALPPSLYLSSKPAFFGSYTWPWVDPTGSTQLYILPAKARYDAGTPFLLPASPPVLTISALVGQPVNGSAIEVKGTGVAGDTVMLYVDGGTTPVGTGTVAADGSFDISTSTTFADGSHTLVATQADAMGVTSTTSNSFAVAVDPSAPTILSLVDQVNGSVAQVTDVKGTGEAGDTLTLYADGGTTPVGTGTVAANGDFDIITSTTFADGLHTLTATQTDAAGLTSAASPDFAVTVAPTTTVISEVGNHFFLDDSSGSGPSLKLGGTDVVAGLFGAWSPFGAVQTASGYEVAWKNPGANQYNVWTTDSGGNFLSQTGVVSGTDYTLESLESTFGQDLNGDGLIGSSTIGASDTLKVVSTYSGQVSFTASTGTLELLNSSSFAGTVAGMTAQDTIDFADIDPTKVHQPIYSGNASGGTVTVTDGAHTANIALLGDYMASSFVASSDGHGGTNVVDPSATGTSQTAFLVQPQHT